MKIIREKGESMYDFLYKLFNKYGCYDLALQGKTNEGGFLRRYLFRELMELPPDRWVKGYYDSDKLRPMTVREVINNASHRTVLDIEVMLDIDDTHHDFLTFNTIKEKTKWIISDLKKKRKDLSIYFTGNKSYHIGYIENNLRDLTRCQRTKFKEGILSFYKADLGKSSELNLIAIEGQPHYRSGRNKRRVMEL